MRQNRPLVAYFSERKDDMISDDERERRLIELLALKVLGCSGYHLPVSGTATACFKDEG